MAAGIWTHYYQAKKHIGDGLINLSTDSFKMSLYTSTSNASDIANLNLISDVSGEVSAGFGYTLAGKLMSGVTWDFSLVTSSKVRFNCAPVTWDASGGDIADIQYAVIWRLGTLAGNCYNLCYVKLDDFAFTITSGNRLSIVPNDGGIFDQS